MQLLIKDTSGNWPIKLDVQPSTTIIEVKRQIESQTGINWDKQKLAWGTILDLNSFFTLASYGIVHDAQLTLFNYTRNASGKGTTDEQPSNSLKRGGNDDMEEPHPKMFKAEPTITPSGATSASCPSGPSAVPSLPSSNMAPSCNWFSNLKSSALNSSYQTPNGPPNQFYPSLATPTVPQASDPIQPVKVAAKESCSNYRPPSVSSDICADFPSPRPSIALPPRSSTTATLSPLSPKPDGSTQPNATSTTKSWGSDSLFTPAKGLFTSFPSNSSGSNQTISNSSSTETPATSASTLFEGNSTTQAPITSSFSFMSSTAPSKPTITTQAPVSNIFGPVSSITPSNPTITTQTPISNIFGSLFSTAPSNSTVTTQAPVPNLFGPVPSIAPSNPTITKTNPPTPQKALSAKMDANRALGVAYQKYSAALNNKSSMVGEIAKAEKALEAAAVKVSSAKATAAEKDKLLREAEVELNQAWKVFEEKKV